MVEHSPAFSPRASSSRLGPAAQVSAFLPGAGPRMCFVTSSGQSGSSLKGGATCWPGCSCPLAVCRAWGRVGGLARYSSPRPPPPPPRPAAARACWGCLSLLLGGSVLPALRAAHRGHRPVPGAASSRCWSPWQPHICCSGS